MFRMHDDPQQMVAMMIAHTRYVALALGTLVLLPAAVAAQWIQQTSNTTADLRGVSVVSRSVAWASGSKGTFLRTTDGGATWVTGTVPGAATLDFRDVQAVDANTAYLMSIGPGEQSRIFKTTDGGRHWTLQFTNPAPKGFLDGMAFWDVSNGIAVSDPVDGRFLIVTTSDGGAHWEPLPAAQRPEALPGDGLFAASGTSVAVGGRDTVWFGTGGAAEARVLRSTDRGRTWTSAPTPMTAGTAAAGIFSLAFIDGRRGVAVGGNYQKPAEVGVNVVLTADGGRTWTATTRAQPAGFRSGVAVVAGKGAPTLIAVGTSGSDWSGDGGATWTAIDALNYNSVAFAGALDAGWAVGPRGRIAKFGGVLPVDGKR